MKTQLLTLELAVKVEERERFDEWRALLNTQIAAFPGFVSLEFTFQAGKWVIVERFQDIESVDLWQESSLHKELLYTLQKLCHENGLQLSIHSEESLTGGITEVFVTEVKPENEDSFREWLAKVHRKEALFPGFRGTYVQSPNRPLNDTKSRNWITLLQFDTAENLDRWLVSKERMEVLKEGSSFISSLESHRVISPFEGWFAAFSKKGLSPALWKQAMLVLLALFPLVMLELRYLNPLLSTLQISLSTFIANAVSVALITWVTMPLAIAGLGWWLGGEKKSGWRGSVGGFLVVCGFYVLEIALFWNLL